jgi:hypothetical protein
MITPNANGVSCLDAQAHAALVRTAVAQRRSKRCHENGMQHVYLFLLYHVYSLFLKGGVDSCLLILLCASTLFEKWAPNAS